MSACPTCHKPATEACTPFCSKRCADVDLGRWFRGDYAVAAVENEEPDDSDNTDHPD